ncbi:HD domain-containing protein [Meiothermus sp. QL-1]|uniref:HD-GYP domain-containing protein n=1 Tax=Meiothermus sp. QL-1 TaxID=2058095 RepID=UPI000E0B54A2|nr:HD domain-containing phosphohydrolase [Meiothermus sp. QL-1]RDI96178.1 HD domain-containing protein [Meiothermus sp. QL-1]
MGKPVALPPPRVGYYILGLFLSCAAIQTALLNIENPRAGSYTLWDLAVWAVLILISKRTSVKLPLSARVSHTFIVALAAVVYFPPWLAPLLVFLSSFDKNFGKVGYPWYKDLFNRVQAALSTGVAALVWSQVQLSSSLPPHLTDLVGIGAASLAYFLVNMSAVTYVIHLSSGLSLRKVWFENFSWLRTSYLLQAPIGLLLAEAYRTPLILGWGGFTVLLIMLLLYFSRYYWDEKVRLEESFNGTIELMVAALDAKDPFTRQHAERVAAITESLAKKLGFDEEEVKRIAYAARLHDIGKVAIPDAVLLKPGRLSPEEFKLIQSHPQKGLEVLRPLVPRLPRAVQEVILHHHERWDGTGYPMGKRGEEIPLWARIVALADAYEAMTAGRPYSPAKSPEAALNEIIMLAGRQFDPKLVRVFQQAWLEDPIWKDREVFLRRSTLPVQLPALPLPSPSAPASATWPASNSTTPGRS